MPQLAFRRRRFATDCLAEGTKRTELGSEGMVLDNWRRDVTIHSEEAKEGGRISHGRFRTGAGFRYVDFSQLVTDD